ncbi:hypothetical protein F5Y16DRAFT_303726 [Xylariaceae sp. FL0255]|nr:hypothetical protein F5Y16DRAFT_303726 [Xylariaceae sp. FL0255]
MSHTSKFFLDIHNRVKNSKDCYATHSPGGYARLTYITSLAKDLPDKYACEECLKLHTVSPTILEYHPFRNWQVQLALKWARTRDAKYDNHLRNLLEQCVYFKIDHPSWDTVVSECQIKPKIVTGPDGDLRFLSHGRILLRSNQVGKFLRRIPGAGIDICYHLWTRVRIDYIDGAWCSIPIDRIEILRNLRCDQCRIEFHSRLEKNGSEIVIDYWKDYGKEGAPTDLMHQTFGNCHRYVNDSRKRFVQDVAETFYPLVSIKDTYENSPPYIESSPYTVSEIGIWGFVGDIFRWLFNR